MKQAFSSRHRYGRRMSAAVIALALPLACTLTTPAYAVDYSPKISAEQALSGNTVFTTEPHNGARRVYIAQGDNVEHGKADFQMPWDVTVSYTLNGPSVNASAVNQAKGLVGIHITVTPNTKADTASRQIAYQMQPLVVLSIPTDSSTDIEADEGVQVEQRASNTVIAALASSNAPLDFHVYADATKFSMSPVALVAVHATNTDRYAQALDELAEQSNTLVHTLDTATAGASDTSESSSDHSELIAKLTQLRNQERNLAQESIAKEQQAHTKAFHAYMDAYVSSYSSHLSGSLGNSTQLTALMGTAGELNGDTALAHAVNDLAVHTNALSDAYQHVGAADETDRIIRRIQQQGTTGLEEELKTTAGQETQLGAQQYAAGQSQLSNAMIPYSMAYTDAYTNQLSTLAHNDASEVAGVQQEAMNATRALEDSNTTLVKNKQSVDAAMSALATAREHTGAGSAAKQIMLRFSSQFADSQSSDEGEIQPINAMQPALANHPLAQVAYRHWYSDSIGGRVEMKRAERIAQLRQEEQEQRQSGGDANLMNSLVTPTKEDSAAEVQKFASAFTKQAGSSSSSKSSEPAQSQSADMPASERLAMHVGDSGIANHQLIHATTTNLVNETVQIGSAKQQLSDTAAMIRDGAFEHQLIHASSVDDNIARTRVLMVVPFE